MPAISEPRRIHLSTRRITCPTCGYDNSTVQYRIDSNSVQHSSIWLDDQEYKLESDAVFYMVKCKDCGLIYTNPQPQLHSGQMPYGQETEARYFTNTYRQREKAYRELFRKLPKFLGRPFQSHLDFGCGDGVMIGVARNLGVRSYGTEISEPLIRQVNERYGPGTIIPNKFDAGGSSAFDVITIINVIEHLTNPLQLLAELRPALSPDGILVIHTINIGGIPARIFKQNWIQIEPLAHLFYFTEDSLKKMLVKAGFQLAGRFDLNTGGLAKRGLHELLGRLNLHLDNGLGVVAKKIAAQ